MKQFLSEENISLHAEHIRLKRLKYSIIESSVPALAGAEVKDIFRIKITERDRRDALDLLSEIKLHDVFFSSFSGAMYQPSSLLKRLYGSEANFLNLLYRRAMRLPYGFVLVYRFGEKIEVRECTDFVSAQRYATPALAIDVCEHAYFMDYGFDRERYLVSALPYLNVAELSAPLS